MVFVCISMKNKFNEKTDTKTTYNIETGVKFDWFWIVFKKDLQCEMRESFAYTKAVCNNLSC